MVKSEKVPERYAYYRTWYNLGDFNDDEKGGGELLTDINADILNNAEISRIIKTGIAISPQVGFDFEGDVDFEEAESMVDPTKRGDFDLSDTQDYLEKAKNIRKEMNKNAKLQKNESIQDTAKASIPKDAPAKELVEDKKSL
jgi:hypothetical protein